MRRVNTFFYLWALPTTSLGLIFLPLALFGGQATLVSGVLEIHGPAIAFLLQHCTLLRGGASAITFGHVVLARDAELLHLTRDHERVHVRQAERWGPFFIPAYLICSLYAFLRRRNPYFDNPFERQAYDIAASMPATSKRRKPPGTRRTK